MVKGRRKTEWILLTGAVLSALWAYFSYLTDIRNVTTYSYTALILFWVYSLRKEIPDPEVKRLMCLGGYLLTLLFIFRFIKYNVAAIHTFPHRLMWYGYYIPLLITPLLVFMISLAIGNRDRRRFRKLFLILDILCAALVLLILTNDLHGLALKIWYENDEEYSSMGALYYLIILWYVGLMLASYVIMYRKCRLSSCRKYWKFPLIVELIGGLLWFWYYIICWGSSPQLNGHSLYNIQEVYVLLFIGFLEALISIGLIPSVSLAKERKWISEGIQDSVRNEIDDLKNTLEGISLLEEGAFRKRMIRAACLGAYIKRRANLELILSESSFSSTGELALSLREALDYVSLSDLSAGFEQSGGDVEVPSLLLSASFDMVKNILIRSDSACYIRLLTDRTDSCVSFTLSVESDMEPESSPGSREYADTLVDTELLDALGADFTIRDEDDTRRALLTASYSLKRPLFSWSGISDGSIIHGLSGLTIYLSLDREALAMKAHIHDSLGTCLLMTKSYLLNPDTVKKDTLLSFWMRVLSEMSGSDDPPNSPDSEKEYYILLAKTMGLEVIINGELPVEEQLKKVADTAITTHLTNVLRHAMGTRAFVTIRKTDGGTRLDLTNDGTPPQGEITETGGLLNLRRQVEESGGRMELTWENSFRMTITLPDGEP